MRRARSDTTGSAARRGALPALLAAFLVALLAAAPRPAAARPAPAREDSVTLTLRSPAFKARGEIPRAYTGDGKDLSPPLAWSGAPQGTKSFALIVDDPDAPDPAAPRMVWVHWLVYDLPASTSSLTEGASPRALPKGTHEGLNDWKQPGWRGPSPPVGRHRYVFHLYALDAALGDLGKANRAALEKAMEGHVVGRAELIGVYARH